MVDLHVYARRENLKYAEAVNAFAGILGMYTIDCARPDGKSRAGATDNRGLVGRVTRTRGSPHSFPVLTRKRTSPMLVPGGWKLGMNMAAAMVGAMELVE